MAVARSRFGEFLVASGALKPEELAAALRHQRTSQKRLEEVLYELGILPEERLVELVSRFTGFPVFSFDEVELTPELQQLVPVALIRRYDVYPVRADEGELYLACRGEVPSGVVENLRRMTGKNVRLVLMRPSELEELRKFFLQGEGEGPVSEGGEGGSAADVLDAILAKAVHLGASDVHLDPEPDRIQVRFRIDGFLRPVDQFPLSLHSALVSRIKVLGRMNIAEKRSPQDGGFTFRPEGGRTTNVRVSVLPSVRGEKVVMRLLPSQERILELKDLGMEGELLEKFTRLLALPHGLILVTGPTGSGKTFTLYAALKHLRRPEVNIITVEDPVELQMEGITQVQVDVTSRKLTFSDALRSILRQDPDVIMVGEIRDRETAQLSLQAALTGHLVLSTLHTNDAVSAVERLTDMGVERYLIAAALRGVLAQRLVRTICPRCRVPVRPPLGEFLALGLSPEDEGEFFAGKGCVYCHQSGYRGRTGIFELLVVDEELQKLIAGGADAISLKEAVAGKMKTMREDGIEKARRGITTLEEVIRVTVSM
ncbi:GspE/PulE family protein [Brockia lithotrophica]|uniref:Type II secretion system protein E (GspE) n=1 Tax=Brockia lithotrophica TaxID=933949 RepID=A0A660L3W3_9BACL|nr:GspE/PulE family protein [Brockia lithotrophica]RKQ88627.1 type II secretion system protein E (GspE) [Brockia lithotrophica]